MHSQPLGLSDAMHTRASAAVQVDSAPVGALARSAGGSFKDAAKAILTAVRLNTDMHSTKRVVACTEQANSVAAGAEGLARSASGSFENAAKGGPGAVPGREKPETMWRRPDNPPKPLRCALRSAAPCKMQAQTVRSPGSVTEPGSEAEAPVMACMRRQQGVAERRHLRHRRRCSCRRICERKACRCTDTRHICWANLMLAASVPTLTISARLRA